MPFPLIALLVSAAGTGLLVSAAKHMETKSSQPTRTSGRHRRSSARNMSRTYLGELAGVLNRGEEPSDRLLESAMCEAVASGRTDVADAIFERFYETGKEEAVDEKDEDNDDEDKPETITVSGKSSPIGGVTNEAWGQFVEKLATKPTDFATDRYVGKYHLRKDRLKELGFDMLENPDDETQYAMLVADLVDARERGEDIVKNHLATVVTIDGTEHPITLSGIMGLLKAAGSRHAKSWLENEADRKQFPSTTSVFLATNGVF